MSVHDCTNKKCPTCCAASNVITVIATDDEENEPPAMPLLFSAAVNGDATAQRKAWQDVVEGNMTAAMFWLRIRIEPTTTCSIRHALYHLS